MNKTFPIPMRGNEAAAAPAGTRPHGLFPIPMRGNEGTAIISDSATVFAVPDPHEG